MNLNFKHGATAAGSSPCSQRILLLQTLQIKLQLSPALAHKLNLQTAAVDQPRICLAEGLGQKRLERKLKMRLRRRTSAQVLQAESDSFTPRSCSYSTLHSQVVEKS